MTYDQLLTTADQEGLLVKEQPLQIQELHARMWAYNKLIGLTGIIRCYEHRCHSFSEMAEYLEVTEEFLFEALKYYRSKYGIYTIFHQYVIYFDPHLLVMKKIC